MFASALASLIALVIIGPSSSAGLLHSSGCPGVDITGVADSTTGLNACIGNLPANGGEFHIDAGSYAISAPIAIKSNGIIKGDGKFATRIVLSSSVQGIAAFQSATPATCTGGAGTCNQIPNTAAKGAGCVCYSNSDCASGTCTPGSSSANSVRYAKIADLGVTIRAAYQTAFDLSGISETTLDNVFVIQSGSIGGTHAAPSYTYGFLFSDLDGAFTGYGNVVQNSHCAGPDATHMPTACGLVLPKGNDNAFLNTWVGNNVDYGVLITSQVTGVPASAFKFVSSTCQTVGTACIDDHGRGILDGLSYFETGTSHYIGESDAKDPTHIANYHSTATAPYVVNSSTTDPFILDAQGATLNASWNNRLPVGNPLGQLPLQFNSMLLANLPACTAANAGAVMYCSNCAIGAACAAGSGALAKCLNLAWVCN
jgi:hypothetical protein